MDELEIPFNSEFPLVVRRSRFLDEMNATPVHWRERIAAAVRRTQKKTAGKRP
jgi:hypothetical protein